MTRLRPSILVVDADTGSRQLLIQALEQAGCVGVGASAFDDTVDRLEAFAYDGLVVDMQVTGGDGLDVLERALTRYPAMPCVVTDRFGSIHHAVRALKRGALDYLIKPVPLPKVVELMTGPRVAGTPESPVTPAGTPVEPKPAFGDIIGRSPAMQPLFKVIECVSPMQSTVLIQGDTGTGKELVARTIHERSPRRDFPFVAFNAAAIPDGLAEAELFGHTKGAFTGAVYTRVGRFEAADRGTLFIDEVSSMSLGLQAKLLRVLQEREIERVGTSRPVKINVRVIAATNADLMDLVRLGRFREDLLYRLNVIRVKIPPLRERLDDVALLALHFVKHSCRLNDLEEKVLSQGALQALMRYRWPGNVRQLQNVIETAVVMSSASRTIDVDALPAEILAPAEATLTAPRSADAAREILAPETPDTGINFVHEMTQLERMLLMTYLKKANGNKRRAARLLQMSRTTLIDKLHRLGMDDSEPVTSSVSAVA